MTTIEFLSDSAKLYQDTVLPVCKKYGLTYMEFGVLMFLYNNPQYNTAAQIVSMRHIPKSHVSISVKSLMEKGLLRGRKVQGQACCEAVGDGICRGDSKKRKIGSKTLLIRFTAGFPRRSVAHFPRCLIKWKQMLRNILI